MTLLVILSLFVCFFFFFLLLDVYKLLSFFLCTFVNHVFYESNLASYDLTKFFLGLDDELR